MDAQATPAIIGWAVSPTAFLLTGVVAALVEIAVRSGFPRNLTAALAVGLGLIGGALHEVFFASNPVLWDSDTGRALGQGLIVGLMASGVWGTLRDAQRVLSGAETADGAPRVERRAHRPPPPPLDKGPSDAV